MSDLKQKKRLGNFKKKGKKEKKSYQAQTETHQKNRVTHRTFEKWQTENNWATQDQRKEGGEKIKKQVCPTTWRFEEKAKGKGRESPKHIGKQRFKEREKGKSEKR